MPERLEPKPGLDEKSHLEYSFEMTPASTDDRKGLPDIVQDQFELVILGDKGYVGEFLAREMPQQGICLVALK